MTEKSKQGRDTHVKVAKISNFIFILKYMFHSYAFYTATIKLDDKCPQKKSTSTRVPQVGFYGCGNNFYLIPAKSPSKIVHLILSKSCSNFSSIYGLDALFYIIFIQIMQGDCLACTNAVFGGGT